MSYKIYSFSLKDSLEIDHFSQFDIKASYTNSDQNQEFAIKLHEKKFSVYAGEVFELEGNEYFVFDSDSLTFINYSHKKSKNLQIKEILKYLPSFKILFLIFGFIFILLINNSNCSLDL